MLAREVCRRAKGGLLEVYKAVSGYASARIWEIGGRKGRG
jgi:hypothetical protein